MKNATLSCFRGYRITNSEEWNDLLRLNDAEKQSRGSALLWERFCVHKRSRIANLNIVETIRLVHSEAQAQSNADHNQAVPFDTQAKAGAAVLRESDSNSNVDSLAGLQAGSLIDLDAAWARHFTTFEAADCVKGTSNTCTPGQCRASPGQSRDSRDYSRTSF